MITGALLTLIAGATILTTITAMVRLERSSDVSAGLRATLVTWWRLRPDDQVSIARVVALSRAFIFWFLTGSLAMLVANATGLVGFWPVQ